MSKARHEAALPPDGTLRALGAALRDFWSIGGAYWRGRGLAGAWGMGLALGVATLAHALIQLRLNLWLGEFFNAIDVRAGATLLRDLGLFGLLALGLMTTAAAQICLKMALQIGWRRWITQRLADRWLRHGHSYVLRFMDGQYDNPDYRIAEDVRLVTEAAVDFGTGLLNSALLLAIFLGVLWSLSGLIRVEVGTVAFGVPGYLVFAAVAYAAMTTTLTHLFGRSLIRVSEDLHAREGDFRYSLVRVRDNAEGIALLRGEADERRGLDLVFDRLVRTWRALMGLQTRLVWLSAGFTVATPIVPLLLATPQYLAGEITLGGLMQASQAFVQVQLALGFVVDNYARLSDWLAGINRVVRLNRAIDQIEADLATPGPRRIEVLPSPEGVLRFIALHVDSPDGEVVIDNATTAIRPGERVLIAGESGVGKTTLIRAVAGLWPWGHGVIEVPQGKRMMFVPHRPYLPRGSLRAAIAYPEPAERFDDAAMRAALARCGLGRYADRLDDDAHWDDVMSESEQQRLAFARLLLHKPEWVLIDEATSELDDAAEADMMALFKTELAGATLVSTGRRAGLAAFHDRTLTLARSAGGSHLVKG